MAYWFTISHVMGGFHSGLPAERKRSRGCLKVEPRNERLNAWLPLGLGRSLDLASHQVKKDLTKEKLIHLVDQKMNKPKPIPTPRTDKETETFEVDPVTKAVSKVEPTRWVTAEFARKLERELAVVRQRLDDETGAS